MPNAFNFSASPFDCLNPHEQQLVRNRFDVVHFPERETILDLGTLPTHLSVIIKDALSPSSTATMPSLPTGRTIAPMAGACHELPLLTLSRVDKVFFRSPLFAQATTEIHSVIKLFQAQRTSHVLVRDTCSVPFRLVIFTATALQRAILDGRPLIPFPDQYDMLLLRLGRRGAGMLSHLAHPNG